MKKTYWYLLAVMLLSACGSSSSEATSSLENPSSGTSTSIDDPLITTAAELAAIANDLDGDYELGADIALEEDWTPIGFLGAPFTGTLNGNDFKITGLSFDTENLVYDIEQTIDGEVTINEAYEYIGLFGVNEGTITDLVLEDASIIGPLAEYDGETVISDSKIYVGSLVGKNYGSLVNVKATGVINVTATVSGLKVGGLVGMSEGGDIYNAESSVDINAASGNKVVAGGIIGEVEGADTDLDMFKATGDVTAVMNGSEAIEEQAYAGGVLGLMQGGTLNDAYASGAISSTISGAKPAYAGGLIAAYDASDFDMAVQDVYASGTVSATSSTETKVYAGGVLGRYEDKEAGHVVSLTNALSSSEVTGSTLSGTKAYVNALIGLCDVTGSTIANSYYAGTAMMLSGKSNGTGVYGTATDMNTITVADMGWNADCWFIDSGVVTLALPIE
ncbi:MAG: hypothetical protein WC399_01830 [Bacilli bacterium]|jgi:hypothetical protein